MLSRLRPTQVLTGTAPRFDSPRPSQIRRDRGLLPGPPRPGAEHGRGTHQPGRSPEPAVRRLRREPASSSSSGSHTGFPPAAEGRDAWWTHGLPRSAACSRAVAWNSSLKVPASPAARSARTRASRSRSPSVEGTVRGAHRRAAGRRRRAGAGATAPRAAVASAVARFRGWLQRAVVMVSLWRPKLILVRLTCIIKCAVTRCHSSAGANPARQLSLQPVAVGADDGGNDIG